MKKAIPLFGVVHLPEMEEAAIDVLRSGQIANGDYINRFENGLGDIVDQANVVSTIDMTSAMFLALYLAGVKKGDEVLTTAFACMSTNSAIAQCGGVPVWVDVQCRTVEVDTNDLTDKITTKTKAAILYHVAGYPGPAKEIAAICKEKDIALIEDCNNALFAHRDGLHVGTHGDFSVYSFYPNRQINTGEGGALICKSSELASRARKLRRFGIEAATFRNSLGEVNPLSDISEIGWGCAMNNLCASLGCAQLPTASERAVKTRENVSQLVESIRDIREVELIPASNASLPAYWVLLLLVDSRDEVLKSMKVAGVNVSSLHQRNDIYSGFAKTSQHSLPNTAYLQEHILSLPCGWWLSPEDIFAVGNALRKSLALPE